jgi:TRAP-type C4-dicarboxylate transport system permease large subunit
MTVNVAMLGMRYWDTRIFCGISPRSKVNVVALSATLIPGIADGGYHSENSAVRNSAA